MTVPAKAFRLLKHHATREDYGSCERNNIPTCHITTRHGKYVTLEIDFITCNWHLSYKGVARLQQLLNWELLMMWMKGNHIAMNKNRVGRKIIVLRGDDILINRFIKHINDATDNEEYWKSKYDDEDEDYSISPFMNNIKGNSIIVPGAR